MFDVFVNAHKVSYLLFSCCSRGGWINCRSFASLIQVFWIPLDSHPERHQSHTSGHWLVPKLLGAAQAALWCYVQCRQIPQETLLLLQHLSPWGFVCAASGFSSKLKSLFAVSLLLLSLPQMLDFNSTESCWPSVWFSWSFCQQGNRDGSPLSVGGEVTAAAINEVACPAFYFCLPVFQCQYTKHECFANILIKDSFDFLFSPPSWGRRMLTKGVYILKFCIEIYQTMIQRSRAKHYAANLCM